jgi:hypothetical protein
MGLRVPLKFHVGERLTVPVPAAYFLAFSGLAAMRRASSVVNGFANDLPQEARPLALRLCWFE